MRVAVFVVIRMTRSVRIGTRLIWPEADAAFGDQRLGELAPMQCALEHRHLHAMAVIEPGAHGGDGEIVMFKGSPVEPQARSRPS